MRSIRKGYVDTDFGQVHYRATRRTFDGPGLPLVLLHQTASSSAMYEPLMDRLGDAYAIIAPDTPGFGGTDAPPEPATIPFYARVLRDALGRLGVRRAWVFGHHTGASIAVQIEEDAPGLAAKMILSGPPYLTPAQKRAFAAKTEPITLDAEGRYLARLWTRIRAKDPEAPLALAHRETVLNLHAGVRYHEAYDAVWSHDFEGQLARVTCPVLLVAGERDALHASLAPALAATRQGMARTIPGAGTYVCDREPDVIAGLVREHFV